MRLVGASNFYILLPFLLESLVAALLGVLVASAALGATYVLVVDNYLRQRVLALPWIGQSHLMVTLGAIAAVGIALSIIPTLLAARKYLRI